VANRRLDNYLQLVAEEGGVSHTMDKLDAADDTKVTAADAADSTSVDADEAAEKPAPKKTTRAKKDE